MLYTVIFLTLSFLVYLVFLKGRNTADGSMYERNKRYLQEENAKLKKELEEEEGVDDELFKEESTFLALGLVATVLFILTGLFSGNKMYSFVGLFLLTAAIFIYFMLPKDKM